MREFEERESKVRERGLRRGKEPRRRRGFFLALALALALSLSVSEVLKLNFF